MTLIVSDIKNYLRITHNVDDAYIESLIETAKANGLNVYTYLEYLLMYMPDSDWQNYPDVLDELMPWAQAVQKECKQ